MLSPTVDAIAMGSSGTSSRDLQLKAILRRLDALSCSLFSIHLFVDVL